MLQSWGEETAEVLAVSAALFAALFLLSQGPHRGIRWFKTHKVVALLLIIAACTLVEVTIEVLGLGTSYIQPMDRAALVLIRNALPEWLLPALGVATVTGSLKFLAPMVAATAAWCWWRGLRIEGVQLVVATVASALVVYFAKSAVGRDRPMLWDTQWYWGSSFPSGHTLSTAAVAATLCILLGHRQSRWHRHAVIAAAIWVGVVGVSRLALGVHWPTDVIAAICCGVLVAAAIDGLATLAGRNRMSPNL